MGQGFRITAKADKAEVYIYEDVGDSFFGGVSAKSFADELKKAGSVKQIDVRINSFGGDVFDGLAIYRQLVDHPAKVTAYIDGLAASIASIIAMAGDEILISEAGFVMIHNASGGVIGTASDMRQMADTLETVTASLADVYVSRTKQTAEQIAAWMDAETWFTAADAVQHGFATATMPNLKLAAKFDPQQYKHLKRVPEAITGRPVFDNAKRQLDKMKLRLVRNSRGK